MASDEGKGLLIRHYEGRVAYIRSRLEEIIDAFSGVHEGEKGHNNEQLLKEFLEEFLPGKYALGSGFIVDSSGGISRQCDLILYDRLFNPELFAFNSEANFYPVEVVYATVEIKTSINKAQIFDVANKIRSVKSLAYEKLSFAAPSDRGLGFGTTKPPLGIMFAYNTTLRRSETILGHFRSAFSGDPPDIWIDCGCILHGGVIATAKLGQSSPLEILFLHHGYLIPTEGGGLIETQATEKTARLVEINGQSYPTLSVRNKNLVVDPARNFLMFLSTMYEFLNKKSVPEVQNVLDLYMPAELKKHLVIQGDLSK